MGALTKGPVENVSGGQDGRCGCLEGLGPAPEATVGYNDYQLVVISQAPLEIVTIDRAGTPRPALPGP